MDDMTHPESKNPLRTLADRRGLQVVQGLVSTHQRGWVGGLVGGH